MVFKKQGGNVDSRSNEMDNLSAVETKGEGDFVEK